MFAVPLTAHGHVLTQGYGDHPPDQGRGPRGQDRPGSGCCPRHTDGDRGNRDDSIVGSQYTRTRPVQALRDASLPMRLIRVLSRWILFVWGVLLVSRVQGKTDISTRSSSRPLPARSALAIRERWVQDGVEDLFPALIDEGYLLGIVTGNLEVAAHIKLPGSVGIACVGVASHNFTADQLKEVGADYVITSLADGLPDGWEYKK